MHVLLVYVRTWVRAHEPEDGISASKLALQYLNAHKGVPTRAAAMSYPRGSKWSSGLEIGKIESKRKRLMLLLPTT